MKWRTIVIALTVGAACSSMSALAMGNPSSSVRPATAMAINGTTDRLLAALDETAEKYQKPKVNARNDRVWYGIPGLLGYTLDKKASLQRTMRRKDDELHLVWKTVKPALTIRSLPPLPIYKGPSEEKSVALMVNVSWGAEYLPTMLSILRREHVKATFFLDGDFVRQHPELAREIRREGHAIGSHGTGHKDFRHLSTPAVLRQLRLSNNILKRAGLGRTALFAPPAGAYDQRTVQAARQEGMYTILWTVDTVDWKRPPASTIVERVTGKVEPGALILSHPTGPTCQALPALIKSLKTRGYHFKTVTQVVSEERALPPPTVLPRKSAL